MEGLIVLGVLAGICYHFYHRGKRTGSRKGYHVGRSHRRRNRRRR